MQHSKGDDFSDRNYIAEVEIQSVEKGAEKLPKEVVFIKYWSPLKRPAVPFHLFLFSPFQFNQQIFAHIC